MNRGGILITGADGFLGRVLVTRQKGSGLLLASRSGAGHVPMDITCRDQVAEVLRAASPRCVIHAAAFTNVDNCERHPEQAQAVHVDGTRYLLEACEETNSRLLFLSTNYVFDGAAGPYDESDEPSPLNVYGRTKLEGERLVLASGGRHLVVRTAVLYGHAQGARPNFVTWAAGQLAAGNRIRVVTDESTNPTFVDELADFLLWLAGEDDGVAAWAHGIVHFAGADILTRFEMVEAVCDAFSLQKSLVEPILSSALGARAVRPPRTGLRIDRARRHFPGRIAPFRENLQSLARRIGDPASLL